MDKQIVSLQLHLLKWWLSFALQKSPYSLIIRFQNLLLYLTAFIQMLYVFTQPLHHGQKAKQGQCLSKVQLVFLILDRLPNQR